MLSESEHVFCLFLQVVSEQTCVTADFSTSWIGQRFLEMLISGFQFCGLHVTASAVSVYHALTADTGLLRLLYVICYLLLGQYTVPVMLKYTIHMQ